MSNTESSHAFVPWPQTVFNLPADGALPATPHVFEEDDVLAINAAIAAERPLLIRGSPGVGKSQLARAAAFMLGRRLESKVIDSRTETRDLMYSFDAVERLARAQLAGAPGFRPTDRPQNDALAALAELLDEKRFIRPGVLWWAFDQDAAAHQLDRARGVEPTTSPESKEAKGVVLLIDEIDKADPSLPNGLLEALGQGRFEVPGYGEVHAKEPRPLVIITTNEERALPDAFLRRCLVHHMGLPDERPLQKDEDFDASDEEREKRMDAEMVEWLEARGERHFGGQCARELRLDAARLLLEDRRACRAVGLVAPGQAEYLDLLRAVVGQTKSASEQTALIKRIARFTLQKHPRQEW